MARLLCRELPLENDYAHHGERRSKLAKTAKMLPLASERRVFAEARVTAYHLAP